eukprot:jgi/Mesen1/9896/ME000070S09174
MIGVRWLGRLNSNFGPAFLLLVILIYWTQGFRAFPWTGISYLLKDKLQLSPSASQMLTSTAFIPWSIKPIYGVMSDCVYIRGARRMPYLVIASALSVASWLAMAYHEAALRSAALFTLLLVCQNLGAALADVVIDAMVAETAKDESSSSAASSTSIRWGWGGEQQLLLTAQQGQEQEQEQEQELGPSRRGGPRSWGENDSGANFPEGRSGSESAADAKDSQRSRATAAGEGLVVDGSCAAGESLLCAVGSAEAGRAESTSVGTGLRESASPERSCRSLQSRLRADGDPSGARLHEAETASPSPSPSASSQRPRQARQRRFQANANCDTDINGDANVDADGEKFLRRRLLQRGEGRAAAAGKKGLTLTGPLRPPLGASGKPPREEEAGGAVEGGAADRPLLWFMLSCACIPSLGTMMFYYHTDHLRLDPAFLGTSRVVGWAGLMGGTLLYTARLKAVRLRTIFRWVHVGLALITVADTLLVSRLSVRLGLPDRLFVLGASALADAINQFKFMPFLVLSARLCPPGIEGTLFAVFMSAYNLGNTVSGYMGASLAKVLGITSPSFHNLTLGIAIQAAGTLVPVCFLFMIPADATGVSSDEGKLKVLKVEEVEKLD